MKDPTTLPGILAPVVIERAGGGTSSFPGEPESLISLRHLTREGTRLLRSQRASIWLVAPDGSQPIRLTAYMREEDRHEDVQAFEDDLGRHTAGLLESLSVLVMEDVENGVPAARPLRSYLQEEGVRALLAVPLRQGNVVRGFLTFEEFSGPRAWSPEDREHAQLLTHQAEELLQPLLDEKSAEMQPHTSHAPAAVSHTPVPSAPNPRSSPAGGERELRARLARLRAMEGSGILAADLAHELLHLLEIQDGYLALLDPSLAERPEDQELLAEAREAGTRARTRVHGFLRWTRDGLTSLHPLELNAFLGRIGSRLGKLTGEKVGLTLIPSFEKVPVRSHPDLLERAVDELIRNARRASPEGGRVRVQVQRSRGSGGREMARIIVEDDGEGISPRDLPWIFEPFFSRDGNGEGAARGRIGLGLPLVQAVTEGHGGWVDLSSVRGKGTRVTLSLPLLVEAVAQPEAHAVDAPAAEVRLQVLLLEDDPFLARLLRRALDREGFEVLSASSVSEAERVLTRDGGHLAAVIVERELEGGGKGMAVVRAARRSRPELPSVVLDRRGRDAAEESLQAHRKREGIPSEVPLLAPPFEPGRIVEILRALLAEPAEGEGDKAEPAAALSTQGEGEPPVH
ncbi:MAG: GAF domain-containing protein [Gemmatimonadales bacterium]|nr:MAG: GAF domain-containing protein [Gemmatimonadales bacterium]